MKKFWIVRHAESEANAGLATASPASISLTERGWKQAQDLIHVFDKRPDQIIISPYLRTKLTASFMARDTKMTEYPIQEFTYLSQEKYANTSIQDRAPGREAYWNAMDPYLRDGVGAETFLEFYNRVRKFLNDLGSSRNTSKFGAVFSHEQFMKVLWWEIVSGRHFAYDDKRAMVAVKKFMEAVNIPNTAILELEFGEGLDRRDAYKVSVRLKMDHL